MTGLLAPVVAIVAVVMSLAGDADARDLTNSASIRSADSPVDFSADISAPPPLSNALGDNLLVADLPVTSIEKVSYWLHNFALDTQGNVLGTRANELFRITGKTGEPQRLNRFDARINSVHVMSDGHIVVATDQDHWDPDAPCRIFISDDDGATFRLIKEIRGGSALWWSIASDSAGRLYVGEYGPRNNGYSKTVHRSLDLGKTWSDIFKAREGDKSHVHRVAVDPFTNDVWVTTGDGVRNRGAWRSRDAGETFKKVVDTQATGIAFTEQAIYFGEDRLKKPGITRFDRQTEKLELSLDLKGQFDTAGSIYDVAVAASGALYASNMKYPKLTNHSSLWRRGQSGWISVLDAPLRPGGGAGFETIGGPDRHGYIYVSGFRILDPARP